MREEPRLWVPFNGVLRRIFGPKRDEVTGEWTKLHNEELNDLYCSPSIVRGDKIKNNEMGGACSPFGEGEGVYRVLVGKRRLRVKEKRVLRRIFGPKGDEVTGEWRKVHNEELNDAYCSPNIARVI